MAKAIETGLPKLRIEEAAAKKQARIDRGDDIIVGVNKYISTEEDEVEVLEIDNEQVREAQINRLKEIKANRNQKALDDVLSKLTASAESGVGNLLELTIEAMRLRATIGEVSDAMENVFGRYKAQTQTVMQIIVSY